MNPLTKERAGVEPCQEKLIAHLSTGELVHKAYLINKSMVLVSEGPESSENLNYKFVTKRAYKKYLEEMVESKEYMVIHLDV